MKSTTVGTSGVSARVIHIKTLTFAKEWTLKIFSVGDKEAEQAATYCHKTIQKSIGIGYTNSHII